MCLKESYFPGCCKVSLVVVPVFKNVGRSSTKNYRPFSLLSVFNEVFETLVNNKIDDHLGKCCHFSHFQYSFRSSESTADLLTVLSDRVSRAFNKSGAARAVVLDISKAFDRVYYSGLFHKLKSCGISGQIFCLISYFSVTGDFGWFWMRNLDKNIQLMLEFLNSAFLVLYVSYYTLMTFLMMLSAVLLSMLMILLSTLNVIKHLISGNN